MKKSEKKNLKLSKETLEVLKNFASINGNLVLTAGGQLKTISAMKNIIAFATIKEGFPQEFGIHDLNEFLGVLSIFDEPELEFSEKSVRIFQGKNSILYSASEMSVLTYPQKDIVFPSPDVSFDLTSKDIDLIRKTSGVLQAEDVLFTGDGNELKVTVFNKKNPSANKFEMVLGSTDKTFQIYYKVSHLKVMSFDYAVDISSKRISRFTAKNNDHFYYIAVEQDSKFGE